MKWFVYMLRCKNDSLYTGVTTDVERRFKEHTSLKTGAKYTKANTPRSIVFIEPCDSRSTAQKRESEIKRLTKIEKEVLVSHYSKTV